MYTLKNNIIDVCNNYYKYLLSLQNVSGVGLGFKYINGKNTFEPCIHVLVEDKLPSKYISSNNLIPKQYMGLNTDVLKVGKARYLSNDAIPQKFRPLEGGSSLGIAINHPDRGLIFAKGTLGCIVTKTNKYGLKRYFILSNNHVLAMLNSLPIGTAIIQPSDIHGGTTSDVIATLSDFIKLKFTQLDSDMRSINSVDCAIAELLEEELASKIIHKIGSLSGYSEVELNEPVKKVGHVSGLTEGHVISLSVTQEILVDEEKNIGNVYINQILAELPNKTGDSGSIVVNSSNKAVGLLYSGTTDNKYAYLNDINLVLNYLNVELYTDD